MNKQNFCQQLKDSFQILAPFAQFNELSEKVAVQGFIRLDEFRGLVQQRQEFFKFYKEVVSDALYNWYDDDEFIDSLRFTDAGRVVVEGELDRGNQDLEYFPTVIQQVNGRLNLSNASIDKLDYLQRAADVNVLGCENLTSLASLEETDRLQLEGSGVRSLPSLRKVGMLKANGVTSLESMPLLKRVEEGIFIGNTAVRSLPELEYVGGRFYADSAAELASLPILKEVKELLHIKGTQITSLPSLVRTGGLNAENLATFQAAPQLKEVFGDCNINGSGVEKLDQLSFVKNNLDASDTMKLQSLQSLQTVGGFELSNSLVAELPELTTVERGFVVENNPQLTSIPQLKSVGFRFLLDSVPLDCLPSLESVGFGLYVKDIPIENFKDFFPSLEVIKKSTSGVAVYIDQYRLVKQVRALAANDEFELQGRIVKLT